MKKFIALLLITSMFFGMNAFAGFEFEDFHIATTVAPNLARVSDIEAETYSDAYIGANVEYYQRDVTYYNFEKFEEIAPGEMPKAKLIKQGYSGEAATAADYAVYISTPSPTPVPVATLAPGTTPAPASGVSYKYHDIENSTNRIRYREYNYNTTYYSVVDTDGNVIVPEKTYDYMFSWNGKITVGKDGKYGIIDASGNVIKTVDREFSGHEYAYIIDEAWDEHPPLEFNENGVAIALRMVDGKPKYGLVNANLEMVVYYLYDDMGPYFSATGLTDVKKGDKVAVMDYTGRLLTNFKYSFVDINDSDIKVTYYDGNRKNTGILKSDYTEYADVEKYSYVVLTPNRLLLDDGKGWFIADDKSRAITGRYSKIELFSEGFYKMEKDGKVGIMNINGKVIVPAEYDNIFSEEHGDETCFLCCITAGDGRTDIYNEKAEKVSEVNGILSSRILFGKYRTVTVGDKKAIAEKHGKMLTEPIYSQVTEGPLCSDGTNVFWVKVNGVSGDKYIDEEFNEIDLSREDRVYYQRSPRNPDITILNGVSALVDTEEMRYIIPYSANLTISRINNNEYLYRGENVCGLFDDKGNKIIEYPFSALDMEMLSDGFYGVKLHDGWHVYDHMGQDIIGKGFADVEKLRSGMYVCLMSTGEVHLLRSDTLATVYNTDKRVMINGFEIPCYDVNGHTVIVAEDLGGYGFDVHWKESENVLKITRNPEYYKVNPVAIPDKGAVGARYTDAVRTNIEVIYNENPVEAHFIGGRMLIRPEALVMDGIVCEYSEAGNEIHVYVDGLEQK